MSAKAKRRRKAVRAEARNTLDPEAWLAEMRRKWKLEEAEELRVQRALEDGTATDEERRRHAEKCREQEKWRQVEEDLRDANIIIESHSYKTHRLIADKHLLRKRLAGWLMETVPLHHVDIDYHDDWNYDVFLYFPTDGELAASAEGGLRREIELGLRGEIERAEAAPPDVKASIFYGSHEQVERDFKGRYELHRRVCLRGPLPVVRERIRGPGRWSDG